MYFSSRELSAAYETEGLALDYWTGCLAHFLVAPAFCMFCTVWVFVILHTFSVCFGLLQFDLSWSCLQGFDATWKQPGKLGKPARHAFGVQSVEKNENHRKPLFIVMGLRLLLRPAECSEQVYVEALRRHQLVQRSDDVSVPECLGRH